MILDVAADLAPTCISVTVAAALGRRRLPEAARL